MLDFSDASTPFHEYACIRKINLRLSKNDALNKFCIADFQPEYSADSHFRTKLTLRSAGLVLHDC